MRCLQTLFVIALDRIIKRNNLKRLTLNKSVQILAYASDIAIVAKRRKVRTGFRKL